MKVKTGEEIFYRELGQEHGGRPILLIHGNESSSYHMLPLGEALAEKYRVIMPDMRGFGNSSYRHHSRKLEDYALDLRSLIHSLKISELIVIGWSFGGAVALKLAEISHRVRGAVLLAPVSLNGALLKTSSQVREQMAQVNQAMITPDYLKLFEPFTKLSVTPLVSPRMQKEFLWNMYMYRKGRPEKELYDRRMDETLKQVNERDVLSIIRHLRPQGQEKVAIPVLILHGIKDQVLPVQGSMVMKEILPRAQLILMDAGHYVSEDQPEETLQHIETFLEGGSHESRNL
ncbi:MAG: alpha/beta hydrolase [Tissierellia bacterium]|nr:alpha/beta hydrolase [Tissierellia bacterium]